jgi:hypothetical protein
VGPWLSRSFDFLFFLLPPISIAGPEEELGCKPAISPGRGGGGGLRLRGHVIVKESSGLATCREPATICASNGKKFRIKTTPIHICFDSFKMFCSHIL